MFAVQKFNLSRRLARGERLDFWTQDGPEGAKRDLCRGSYGHDSGRGFNETSKKWKNAKSDECALAMGAGWVQFFQNIEVGS